MNTYKVQLRSRRLKVVTQNEDMGEVRKVGYLKTICFTVKYHIHKRFEKLSIVAYNIENEHRRLRTQQSEDMSLKENG